MKRLAVIGGGSWGTALAIVLAPRFQAVRLWVYEPDLAARMAAARENDLFLPGLPLPEPVEPTSDLAFALEEADLVVGVMPSQHARGVYRAMAPYWSGSAILLSATKGFERSSLLRISEVAYEALAGARPLRFAALSGPTFAREVARGEPTAVVVASSDRSVAEAVQTACSGPTFRLYTSPDLVGVEVGAALKNVIAIGAGVVTGLGLGSNTRAALIARGLAEITRLALAMGADPRTLAGLAGLGDLVLTCTGELSRNRSVGIELASGKDIGEITGGMRMVAEGVETTYAAVELARRHGVNLPIIFQMERLFRGEVTPREAIRELMERTLKPESV